MSRLLDVLQQHGWKVARRSPTSLDLGSRVRDRYRQLPDPYTTFLASFDECVSANETAWFLSDADFQGASESAFSWDEWERISLEALADDPKATSIVRAFWDRHLPILQSVGSGYEHLSLCLQGENAGAVVHGTEPEFEEVEVVVPSFADLEHVVEAPGDFGLERLFLP